MSLEELRKKIDETDRKLLELLNQRAKLAQEIGKIKKDLEVPYFVPGRECDILERLTQNNPGPLPDQAIQAIYREILSASRALEHPLKVAYWGPPASHSHTAAMEKFGASTTYVPVHSLAEVFRQVEKHLVDFGIVPCENSTEGVIPYTLDLFVESEVRICAEHYLPVSHYLLSWCRDLAQIRRVYVSAQPLAQCRQWLTHYLGHAEVIEVSTTSQAAQECVKDPEGAAVASKMASEVYGLPILAEKIEDNPQNRTRFFIIGFQEGEPTGRDKTSLLLSLPHKPGALFKALEPLARHQINLTMIQSRPTKRNPWEYLFFLDVQGHYATKPLSTALKELEEVTLFLKVLGSYCSAE